MDLTRRLSYEWRANEQYAYGWFVPILAVGLLAWRWFARPAPNPPKALSLWMTTTLTLVATCYLPLRVIYEVNPDWPLISWSIASGLVVISVFAVYLAGGADWVKHLAGPICFMLVAVRWPYRIEEPLTQGLMRIVSAITVEAVQWIGIPALQHGNVIELGTCRVGVEEACSGIRSFQSTVMSALFLSILFLLKRRGWLLLLIGLVAAFGLNVLRTFFLTWQAASGGSAAIAKWHDLAGWGIFLIAFLALWAFALFLRPASTSTEPQIATNRSTKLPTIFVYALTGWTLIVVAGNELWFRLHELWVPATVEWSVRLPAETPGFKEIQLTDAQKSLLKQDVCCAGSWPNDTGQTCTVYYLRWFPGSLLSRIEAHAHRPEICLPASGFRLEKEFGSTSFKVGALELPFRRYLFNNFGNKVYVFFCLWEDGAEHLPQTENLTYRDRLRAALRAQRQVGQRSVEIILRGCPSLAAAESAILERLPHLIRIEFEPPPPTALTTGRSTKQPPLANCL